jgi:Fe-S cluster assembly iron-binding protein IscA
MATIEQSETTVVTLTEGAATKVSKLMAQEPAGEAEVLRIAIQGGGCSGFEYALGFDRGAQSGDHELEFHGFKIENPNVSSACGCGHSFQVEDGEAPAADAGCGSGCGHAH